MRGATAAAMRDPAPYVSALALHRLERYLRMPLLKMASHPTQEQVGGWGCGGRCVPRRRLCNQQEPCQVTDQPSLPHPVPQICQWYTLALQAILGWAAPVLVWACADVRAAVQHAQRRGISPDDPLHRLFRRLHGLCSTQALLQVVLGLAAAALALAAAGLLYSGGAW